ncbi:hypothetical protein Lalb_Chr17g0336721 [Lupinus albus]|uniref:Uncharacterized protein n=1 Tax=Lupinus albus TaxID=3870 RepID=A0A6A4P0X0_LUPAL|nr:hypothetical protein Lalb_Chr17g0336721 [Lupinus albus]
MTGVNRVKSLSRKVRLDTHLGSHASECIQGLRVPLNEDDFSKIPYVLAGHANRESLIIIRPTLLDQKSSEIKVLSHQHENSSVSDKRGNDRTIEPWKTRVQPQHQEPEESCSNSNSSSRYTTQEDSTNSSSDSEDYSLQDGTQGPASRRLVEAKYKGSSNESSNSYPYKDDGSSRSAGSLKYDGTGSIKSYRYVHKRNPEKKIGSLSKLKNKLGLIFHHHHHHLQDNYDNGSIHTKAGHKHSMWNHLQNAFRKKNKHMVLRKGMVDKRRRGAIAKVTNTNQVGQFHRLVEGILTRFRHSKKPNPSKLGGVKGSRSTPHRHSQKKLQPWRGVLKDRGRVKMGFMSQKSIKN